VRDGIEQCGLSCSTFSQCVSFRGLGSGLLELAADVHQFLALLLLSAIRAFPGATNNLAHQHRRGDEDNESHPRLPDA